MQNEEEQRTIKEKKSSIIKINAEPKSSIAVPKTAKEFFSLLKKEKDKGLLKQFFEGADKKEIDKVLDRVEKDFISKIRDEKSNRVLKEDEINTIVEIIAEINIKKLKDDNGKEIKIRKRFLKISPTFNFGLFTENPFIEMSDVVEAEKEANEMLLSRMLLKAGQDGSISLALRVLLRGVDVKRSDVDGRIFLHWTASGFHLDMLRFFLKSKAFDIIKDTLYMLNDEGETILGSVVDSYVSDDEEEKKKESAIKLLQEIGINPLIGNIKYSDYIKDYKQKWINALERSNNLKELKENLKKEGINTTEELLVLSFTQADSNFASILAENCSPLLSYFLAS